MQSCVSFRSEHLLALPSPSSGLQQPGLPPAPLANLPLHLDAGCSSGWKSQRDAVPPLEGIAQWIGKTLLIGSAVCSGRVGCLRRQQLPVLQAWP